MSNRLFQGIITQMQEVIGKTVGVIDENATIIACSDLSKIGGSCDFFTIELGESRTAFVNGSYVYKPFGSGSKPDFAVFVEGTDENAEKFAELAAVSLTNIKSYYDEKYDRANFIKNVMLNNILPGEIAVKSRELHFTSETVRVVFLLRVIQHGDMSALDVIQNLFPDKNKDFVFSVADTDVVLVKELKAYTDISNLEKLAHSIADTLTTEFYTPSAIGIGTPITGIKDLSRSFQEAQIALDVGKVFDTDKTIVSYDNLGIARLIYHLPQTMCDDFMREVFKRGSIDSLDHETLFTIQKFFENNLNVSETSRRLFVHRNTLVYRLDKIKKLTGLDLREFDHAIVFKIALMVRKRLGNSPGKF